MLDDNQISKILDSTIVQTIIAAKKKIDWLNQCVTFDELIGIIENHTGKCIKDETKEALRFTKIENYTIFKMFIFSEDFE